jgi:signal transduction histidine kinase
VDLREEHVRELERAARERLPLAQVLLVAFLVGALPIEAYYYPAHRDGYVAVLALEVVVSLLAYVAVRLRPDRARVIALAWASAMGLCILGYYPLVDGDATLALAAVLCLISAMPALLPFGLWHQVVLCLVCGGGFMALAVAGVSSALPWPYLLVALAAVGSLSTIGARSLVHYRLEALQRESVLRQAQSDLYLALRRAQEAVEMRSRLVANVSHELRTPVNVIIGYADMVLDAVDDASLVRNLSRRIREYAVSLDTLIAQLLDLSRLSCGKLDAARESVDLARLIDDVAHDARLLVRGKPVAIVAECAVPTVTSDRMRIRQILNNLVTNAARATASGRIAIAARAERDMLVLTVSDTGCGIAHEEHERIFDAFEQGRDADTGVGGIGLGLAIVRQLAELLGGGVTLASTLGAGSTFTVRLPGALEDAAPESRHASLLGAGGSLARDCDSAL